MGTYLVLRIANLLAFVATVAVNALATLLPLGGMTTGELSDLYPSLFTPAGLTFSIWGVIYLLLAIYVVAQLVAPRPYVEKVSWLFVVSSLANMGWIASWHLRLVGLSFVVMLILLATLLAIYVRLFVGRSTGSAGEKWLVHVAFSVYLGWITVATVANATALLVHLGWGGFGLGDAFWAVVMVAAATLITLLMILRRSDIFYGLVVAWALLGITLANRGRPGALAVVVAAWVGIGLILVAGVLRARKYATY